MNRKYGAAAPAVFVFFFHVHHRAWFSAQMKHTTTRLLPPPELTKLFGKFSIGRNLTWLPDIAHIPELWSLANPVAKRLADAMVQGGGGINAGNIENQHLDDNPRPLLRQRIRAVNLNRSPLFTAANTLNTRIARKPITPAIALGGAPPKKNGRPLCLSWHLKGTCFDDCGRVLDHNILSDEEATELYGWCRVAFP